MAKRKSSKIIWAIIIVLILLVLNGKVDLSSLFSVSGVSEISSFASGEGG